MRRYRVERAYRGDAILIERFGTRGPLEGLRRALYRILDGNIVQI